jgi:fatty-acyl-CoA synthase
VQGVLANSSFEARVCRRSSSAWIVEAPCATAMDGFAIGDIGYVTEDGEIVVCGRNKDMIIVSGRNIYPTDLERAAEAVAGVRRGSAVAVSLTAGQTGESFAIVAESHRWRDDSSMRRSGARSGKRCIGASESRPR